MLGQLETGPMGKRGSNSTKVGGAPDITPQGCFVILPAPNGTLLVKSVAVQELLLPCNALGALDEQTDGTSLALVSDALDQVRIWIYFGYN
jgi:hypothetical protein